MRSPGWGAVTTTGTVTSIAADGSSFTLQASDGSSLTLSPSSPGLVAALAVGDGIQVTYTTNATSPGMLLARTVTVTASAPATTGPTAAPGGPATPSSTGDPGAGSSPDGTQPSGDGSGNGWAGGAHGNGYAGSSSG